MTGRSVIPIRPLAAMTSPELSRLAALPPLALYIHFPWCVRKCPYCDFNSNEVRGAFPEDAYLCALIEDLETALPKVWGRPVVSVFIGGGTPSLLSPAAVETLLCATRARLPLVPDAEITLEANPGSAEVAKFAAFRAAGVNRISLGVQSFNRASLAALGRIHDDRSARAAVDAALKHFDNVNLDLMYCLPDQTSRDLERDVEAALSWGVTHLSTYQLTLEPNTAFARHPPPLPDEDAAADMQSLVEETLASSGYEHYEVSAFARPGWRCAHNTNYWKFGDYLGIGAGAHSKLSFPDRVTREIRLRHPEHYMGRTGTADFLHDSRRVSSAELPFEFMMNALRLVDGFEPALFAQRTGLPLQCVAASLQDGCNRGLLQTDAKRIAATRLGLRFLNDLLIRFLPPA